MITQSKKVEGMGFQDLKSFNFAMLTKQGWRLLQNKGSLVHQCLKARYFPRCNFPKAVDSPNSSFVWKSITAAQLVLKSGSCLRVGDGVSIRVVTDNWIPNHPTKKILFHPVKEEWEWRVSNLMDPESSCWNKEVIMAKFHRDDVEAILCIPFMDSVMWLHTTNGMYLVKSGYHVATQVLRDADYVESSRGPSGNKVWAKLWKFKVPNKIKVFSWRVCQNIRPTRDNLVQRKIILDNT